MFNAFKTFLLTAVLCINGIYSVPEQADSGSGNNQAPLNTSVVDYPLTLPVKILQQLAVDISDDSKGLFALWSNAFYLTKERLLTVEYADQKYKGCIGLIFTDLLPDQTIANVTVCDSGLKRIQLVSYYNELVIQLKIAENLVNTSIPKEIQERWRTVVERKQRKVIKLLRENILPLIENALNITDDEVNCNSTESIVNSMMSIYHQCTAIQTANTYLSQTAFQLRRILLDQYIAQKNGADNPSSETDEMIITDNIEAKEWCII